MQRTEPAIFTIFHCNRMVFENSTFLVRNKRGGERPHLVPGMALAGFATLIIIVLAMIFPKPALLRQIAQARLGDPLAVSYLANLLRADPDNLALRLLLAQHKYHQHETGGLDELLEPVLRNGSPAQQAQALLIQYQLLAELASSQPPDSKEATSLRDQRIEVLTRLHTLPLSLTSMLYLAHEANRLQQADIAASLYKKIRGLSSPLPPQQLIDLARSALAKNDHDLAAYLYFLALDRAPSLATRRAWFITGVRTLMAAERYADAMRAIDQHLGPLADDPETLYELIQIARAANDQARAVRYAKRMLRLSQRTTPATWVATLDLGLIGITSAHASETVLPTPSSPLPYEAQKYELAYQVFLENGELKDAMRVAEAAIKQVPNEAVWHRRLAQLAEWTGQPSIALREWRWLLNRQRDSATLQKVIGLATSLYDFELALDAWKKLAASSRLNNEQWRYLADLFELVGQPHEGVRYFEARYANHNVPLYLELAAQLAERNGDDERAMILYARLLDRHGNHSDWLLRLVNLHLRHGHYRTAYDLLQAHRHEVKDEDATYWKMLADLAWALQQDVEAEQSLRRLQATGQMTREDFSRLILLLGQSRQREKADLAELAYQRFNDWEMLLLALELRSALHEVAAQRRLIERALLLHQPELAQSARFYLLRAQYFQTVGQHEAARLDFDHAITLAPDDANILNATLWFLIDTHDLAALRKMTARMVARGLNRDSAYWQALGAAYQVLDQPHHAVEYFRRQFKQGERDVLWLANFADALDLAHQPASALRLRRYVWRQLRANQTNIRPGPPFTREMLLAARLALLQQPDDPGLALVRSLVKKVRLTQKKKPARIRVNGMTLAWETSLGIHREDREIDDLVLGWAVSTEQSANAKAWLWRRFGQSLAGPQWAIASVAIAEQDLPRLSLQLARDPGSMSMLMRHDVAKAIGQERLAQSIVFSGLADDPDNAEAHQRLVEDALATASQFDLELKKSELGNLHGITRSAKMELKLNSRSRIAATFGQTHQASGVPLNFGNTPAIETVMGIRLEHHGNLGTSEILLQRRRELATTTSIQAYHGMDILPRLNLRLGIEVNADAPGSEELWVFGMRDRIVADLLYRYSRRDYATLHASSGRYHLQSDGFLGNGQEFSWELGHRLRIENPDLKLRLTGVHARFNPAANAAIALPEDVDIFGLCLGSGDLPRPVYTRAWRLGADVCISYNDIGGAGYNATFGLAGSVLGSDQLSLFIKHDSGGANFNNALMRELILDYRYFY